jgi:hypothetical protein
MNFNKPKANLLKSALAASLLLAASSTALAAGVVTLTATPTSAVLSDGQSVPMWGLLCGTVAAGTFTYNGGNGGADGATCTNMTGGAQTGAWQPPLIKIASGQPLSITLVDNLHIATVPAGGFNDISTSLVIVGQIGGGLGAVLERTTIPSPAHIPQGTTWPGTPGSTGPDDAVFNPPAQAERVKSFATEVNVSDGSSGRTLTWNNLRPGTYLIESGTEPSIQGPMGLYGVLLVTNANYPGQSFDQQIPLLLSEIDPVQNTAVQTAVQTAGFDEKLVWSGQTGACGDPAKHSCYPPAVNYSPLYYLINGVSLDRGNLAASTVSVAATPPNAITPFAGRLLLSFVNAGLRMHVPSVVGANMTLLAEDGNKLPGVPKVQSEVFLPAGKTYDVTIAPAQAAARAYAAATYPVFDRQLSLSTDNQRDGGMQAYIKVGAGAAANTAGSAASAVAAKANPDQYYVVSGNTLTVSDPHKGLLGNDVGISGVAVSGGLVAGLTLNANGTFTYTGGPTTFGYCGNGVVAPNAACAMVTLAACTGSAIDPATGKPCLGAAPSANPDSYTSKLASRLHVAPPGVLANDSDPLGLPLHACADPLCTPGTQVAVTVGSGTVTLNADGSFTVAPSTIPMGASAAQTVSFAYYAVNSQNTAATTATTATVTFNPGNGIKFTVHDAKDPSVEITDYRWIIEEDRTTYIDPNIETLSSTPPMNLAVNFHASHTPVLAQGCTGQISCESGQTLRGMPAICDVGNGGCREAPSASAYKTVTRPGEVSLDPNKRYYISILPGDAADPGHGMSGAQISTAQIAAGAATTLDVTVQPMPYPSAKISVFVFEDDFPLNGENDTGGGVDVLAPNEPGLEGFNIVLLDQTGQFGDPAGQLTYDEFGQPVTNALAGTIDPVTGLNACPISPRSTDAVVGVIVTCPKYEDGTDAAGNKVLSPLAGHAVIANMYPGLYEVHTTPGADRAARGEEWLQTNTLDGTKDIEAFIKADEPGYFQEFGPGGYHVAVGFANPKIINDRLAGVCAGHASDYCSHEIHGVVTNTRMSRTPDQRVYSSGSYDAFSFAQCYVSLGAPDDADFAFTKCNADGTFAFTGIPAGDLKITVFDQWNDLLVDGLSTPIRVNQASIGSEASPIEIPITQWRTNLYGRIFLDQNGDNVSQPEEPGLPLVPYNIRYRDGSYMGFNNTDLNGYAGFNEVFPFLNWLVVDTDSARYKQTGVHVVYDAGGAVDGTAGGGSSEIGAGLANTIESSTAHLPNELRVPGARYCAAADCTGAGSFNPASGNPGSTGRIDPGYVPSEGWQGLLGQNSFIEFAMRRFAEASPGKPGENGGIRGHVIYTSTRPFDDPSLLLQLSWEPGVANVKVNLYREGTAPDGTATLTLVDTTSTSSWDDWAQGFRRNANGTVAMGPDGKPIPNMSCPGQETNSPFYYTMQNSTLSLQPGSQLTSNGRFKCYDGWSMLNQVQPVPYNGMYKFPSVVAKPGPTRALPGPDEITYLEFDAAIKANVLSTFKTNCTICVANPVDGTPMLPAGKYVVEVVVPEGYELVKEEDKNILLGDAYVAPVTTQFAGFGNIFIVPDQAAVGASYNSYNPIQATSDNGAQPRHEGDTGSVEVFWPCVGARRVVPDLNSLFPGAGQQAPFAGATRPLCDRKEVTLEDQMTALAKFYVFTSAHIAGHYTGTITNDFASEFDPFSPQFGEKFAPPNLPVAIKDYAGKEISRTYADQWGLFNGLTYSTWTVNPPSPSGYIPQMMLACMNDPGPIRDTRAGSATFGQMITDPAYNPGYSNFCYEIPFMPGETAYLDTPVIPTEAFAAGYNLPDCDYPDTTPAIRAVRGDDVGGQSGPWVGVGPGSIASLSLTANGQGYRTLPTLAFSGGLGAGGTAATGQVTDLKVLTIASASCSASGFNRCSLFADSPPVSLTGGGGSGASATATKVGSSINFTVMTGGSGYTSRPTIRVSRINGSTLVLNASSNLVSMGVNGVALLTAGSGYTGTPMVSITGGSGAGAAAAAALGTSLQRLTITALGDKDVVNHAYAGPQATGAPYNKKFITRHYGFGAAPGSVALVGSDGVAHNLTVNPADWSDGQIIATVSGTIPACAVQQRNAPPALCGELVITAANGKQSIDTVTVTIGGKIPTIVTPTSPAPLVNSFGRNDASPLQTAIDNAQPGDLIIVTPGTYRENVLLWKPVRLQGVGAESVFINADAHPAGKIEAWRRQVDCLFGLTLQGRPLISDGAFDGQPYDPSGAYSCPASMQQRVDRIPFEAIVGWDASGNGNLAQMLQEPTLMGAYEGAGITALGRGIRIPANSNDFWGASNAGGFPAGFEYLTTSDCSSASDSRTDGRDYGTSNFLCNPSRIDGISVINSSQGGGAIFLHAWNHGMEIANTRVHANHGTLTGGITVGNGEFPDHFIAGGDTPPPPGLPANGLVDGEQAGYGFNRNVNVHHNSVTANLSVGDALYSGTPSAAGGVTFCVGADAYKFKWNWICGNMSSGDAGGVAHVGFINDGTIAHNWILFNQSQNPTIPTNGGGLGVLGASPDRTLPDGTECGALSDQDCPPGLPEGTGRNLLIDANLILGNSAEAGTGGGLRLQMVNGDDVIALPGNSSRWNDVTVTNNIIANNVAGWDGAGVSMQDAFRVKFVNNTVMSNDTTASAGVLFNTLGAPLASVPPPGCTPGSNANATCPSVDTSTDQPSGFVTMLNTPNMVAAMAALPGGAGSVRCPTGYAYSTGNNGANECRQVSLPLLTNDLFFRNRSFHIGVADLVAGAQQKVVTLYPTLDQGIVTGSCPASGGADPAGGLSPPNNSSAAVYWDIGVRGDASQTPNSGSGFRLLPNFSILTSTSGYTGANNVQPGNAADVVIHQYCNGARIPPEHCSGIDSNDPIALAQCKGYFVPPGHSESTGTYPVFQLAGIQPSATVDEGNNWINLSYGPLSLSNASQYTAKNTLLTPLGNYAISGGPALSAATSSAAPDHDFYGNPRPQGTGYDIGAVEIGGGGSGGGGGTPTLTILDNFNRASAFNLTTGTPAGVSWNQVTLFGAAAIATFDTAGGNTATGVAQDALIAGNAMWNGTNGGGPVFGNRQAAAFTFRTTPASGFALILKASGTASNATGLLQNFVRVLYSTANGGTITVQTTTNGNAASPTYTPAGTTITGVGLVNGDVLTAMVDQAGVVTVWKTSGATVTQLGTRTPAANALWSSGGRIGIQMPAGGARLDDFAGGNVP